MNTRGGIVGAALVAVLALTPAAFAQDEGVPLAEPEPPALDPPASGADDASNGGGGPERTTTTARATAQKPANMSLRVTRPSGSRVDVGERVRAVGRVWPFVPNQKVQVWHTHGDKVIKRTRAIQRVKGRNVGKFVFLTRELVAPDRFRIRAFKPKTPAQEAASGATRRLKMRYPDLDPGDRSDKVKLFKQLLDKRAYHVSGGERYDSATSRAVLAYRKVNGMRRTGNANRKIFRTLADGKGGFRLKWPEGGKHVETDLSRQVMVLAKRGKPRHIFHISSGAPATPTVRGKFPVYRFEPGYNSKRMYYSVYFHGGYATHGYDPVPTYPASHGCLRNPIPNSRFIYRWLDYGDVFYIYG